MISQDQVSIIIPHLGGTAEAEYALDECLKSLNETVPDIKVVLAINGHSCIAHQDKWDLKIKRQGQNGAVNAAVATTNTPWIFITNDDMVYAPGWFEKLTNHTTRADFTYSPQLVEPRPGAPTFEVFFAGGAGGDFNKELFLEYERKIQGLANSQLRSGFNLPFLIHRSLWDMVGGYDINYDPWGSNGDSDLEYKIMLAGAKPKQNTNCLVYHFSQTSGTFEPRNDSYRFRNYAYFKEKWGFDRTDDGIWEASFSIPTKEEGRIFLPSWENHFKS